MGLAGTEVAERDDVLSAEDVAAALQLPHEHLVLTRGRREVEGVEGNVRPTFLISA